MAKTAAKPTAEEKRRAEAEALAAELIAMIEAGTAPWQKPWTPEMCNDTPFNLTTREAYRGLNALLLLMSDRKDPRWMTYKQAQAAGAQVRKGEHGISLLRVITHEIRSQRDENGNMVKDTDGNTVKERFQLEKPIFKPFTVFNAEQIDGLPEWKPQPLPAVQWDGNSRAERILAASGAQIEHIRGNRAFYRPLTDTIVLPQREQFPDAGSYYGTALHELGHWTGHESRLNRSLSGGFGSISYAKEELRAEIASMMLSRTLGVPHDPSQHAAYVENWVQVLKNDPEEILRAATDAGKIQHYLLDFAPELSQTTEPAAGQAAFLHPTEQKTDMDTDHQTEPTAETSAPDVESYLKQAAQRASETGQSDLAYIRQLTDEYCAGNGLPDDSAERFEFRSMLYITSEEFAGQDTIDAEWIRLNAQAYENELAARQSAPQAETARVLPETGSGLDAFLKLAAEQTLHDGKTDYRYLQQLADAYAGQHGFAHESEARYLMEAHLVLTAGNTLWDGEIDHDQILKITERFEDRYGVHPFTTTADSPKPATEHPADGSVFAQAKAGGRFAGMSDLEKAFLQIGYDHRHTIDDKFFWVNGNDVTFTPLHSNSLESVKCALTFERLGYEVVGDIVGRTQELNALPQFDDIFPTYFALKKPEHESLETFCHGISQQLDRFADGLEYRFPVRQDWDTGAFTVLLPENRTEPLPPQQTAEAQERLQRAKERYDSQSPLLSFAFEKAGREIREAEMIRLTATMPDAERTEAWANFYEAEVQDTEQMFPHRFKVEETAAEHVAIGEAEIER